MQGGRYGAVLQASTCGGSLASTQPPLWAACPPNCPQGAQKPGAELDGRRLEAQQHVGGWGRGLRGPPCIWASTPLKNLPRTRCGQRQWRSSQQHCHPFVCGFAAPAAAAAICSAAGCTSTVAPALFMHAFLLMQLRRRSAAKPVPLDQLPCIPAIRPTPQAGEGPPSADCS